MMDLPTNRSERLDAIGNSSTQEEGLFIKNYPNSFKLDHLPSAGKWYLYSYRHLPVTWPIDAYIIVDTVGWSNGSFININGTEVLYNTRATLYVSHYIYFELNHICINRSLVDAFNNSNKINVFGSKRKALFISANTVIGYTNNVSIDFLVYDTYESNFPLVRGEG
ncbi:MAG: hypothetical protein ACTSR3_17765 [Candidatus Helarchaeota archaeon]